MKQYLDGTLTADRSGLMLSSRDLLSRRCAALIIALTSCGLWVILVRVAVGLS